MPEPVTWYDVLGVTRGASAVTLRRAYDERLLQLRSYVTLVSAAARAAVAVEGLVIGQSPDPGQTVRYRSRLTVQVWHPARDR